MNLTYLEKDIFELFGKLVTSEKDKKYVCIRLSRFQYLVFKEYPLRYQRNNVFIVSRSDIVELIRSSELLSKLVSKFKFKGKNPKRIKIIASRINTHKV